MKAVVHFTSAVRKYGDTLELAAHLLLRQSRATERGAQVRMGLRTQVNLS